MEAKMVMQGQVYYRQVEIVLMALTEHQSKSALEKLVARLRGMHEEQNGIDLTSKEIAAHGRLEILVDFPCR